MAEQVEVSTRTAADAAGARDDRAAWSSKLQFFLSIVGYSVGLGNIWRFPYLCQQNGGGAFLIPFATMLVVEGVPLFLVELGMGQRLRRGSLGVWSAVHPWLGGIGVSSCVVTLFVALYYNVIIAWCFFYLFSSLQRPLPWSQCPVVNGSEVAECARSSETAYFWYRTTLDSSASIEESGGLKWWIVALLLLAWLLVYLIMMKGIQSSGKVVYITSLFPYVVLTIFFVRGMTLKGASAGLAHMYTPKVEKLLNPQVWLDAATQVFYSFGLAFGSLIAFGSYNPPNNNCVRDVILVSVTNAFTAIYASVVVFSILGFKATTIFDKCILGNKKTLVEHGYIHSLDVSSEEYDSVVSNITATDDITKSLLQSCSLTQQLDQAAEGTGLAFIVFTQAIVELPGSPFWAAIFFLMLLSLGLGSQIGIMEGVLCTLFDMHLLNKLPKQLLTGLVCLACFLVGLVFCTGAGEYWLTLFDSFAGTIGLALVAFLETVAVMYVYGHSRFTQDIEDMTGYKPGLYWQVTWRFLGPLVMFIILASSIFYMIINKPKYKAWDKDKGEAVATPYPDWVMAVAVAMVTAGVLPILVVFVLRRFQWLQLDVNVHQGSIRRNDTTVSTKQMMADVDLDGYEDVPQDSEDDDPQPQQGRLFRMDMLDD